MLVSIYDQRSEQLYEAKEWEAGRAAAWVRGNLMEHLKSNKMKSTMTVTTSRIQRRIWTSHGNLCRKNAFIYLITLRRQCRLVTLRNASNQSRWLRWNRLRKVSQGLWLWCLISKSTRRWCVRESYGMKQEVTQTVWAKAITAEFSALEIKNELKMQRFTFRFCHCMHDDSVKVIPRWL